MKTFPVLLAVCAVCGSGWTAAMPDATLTTRSHSGQFFVHAPASTADSTLVQRLTEGGNYIQLDSPLLVVSCERIKQLLWRKLGDKPSWRDRIYLELRAAHSANDNVRMISQKFADGWRYRLQLPDVIERERYVRAIVQVLLQEMANRGATERSVELPLWMVEGFSHEILASGDMAGELKVILPPPNERENDLNLRRLKLNERRTNSLYWAHVVLSSQPPLTFEELSWPAEDQLATEASEVYQSCAQLCVVRLLEFPDGPASFRVLLEEFPHRLNWQLAFLKAFQAHFQSMLDMEKWWAVQVSHFTDRDLQQTWSYAESWIKLDEIMRTPVQVRMGGGDQPLRTELTLQSLLRDSNGLEQAKFFRQRLDALTSVRMRASPEMVRLVDDYRNALAAYLEKQKITNPFLRVTKVHELVVNRAAKELVRQLDALDARRETLRPQPPKPDAIETENISAAFR